jgi:histidinol-phosphatase (PHP family)
VIVGNGREEIAHDTWAVEPFVEAARAAGVDEIGFTEHVYYFKQTRSLWTVPYQTERCVYEIEPYVQAVVAARDRGLPVKLGLEVDYVPGHEDETRELLAPYPWNYLLGSVHFIDELGVDGGEPRLLDRVGVDEAWSIYFETLAAATRSGLFDSLSHPDLVKIFGERPVEPYDYGPVVDTRFLAACRERDVPVTLASDAHSPDVVGRDFDLALELLRSAGYDTITVFERRRGRQEPLG